MTIKEPMSDTLVDAIRVARLHDDQLVRRSHFRGCWTYRDCPLDSAGGLPAWWVCDSTVHALIKREIAVVTHTRNEGRPAVVRVRSEAEMAEHKAIPFTIVVDGISFCGFTAPGPMAAKELFDALRYRPDGSEVIEFNLTDTDAKLLLTVEDDWDVDRDTGDEV